MRRAFTEALCRLAETDERIWLLCGDLGYSVLEGFAERFPGRFVNAGVAEQNMTGMAAGLALSGKVVFTYSIANFPVMRCLEQIRNDVCYHDLDVKIVSVGAGLVYGSQGYTHHGVEDVAVMRALPNMTVVVPADPVETVLALEQMVETPGPCYLRLSKSGNEVIHASPPHFRLGHALVLRDGADLTLVSCGRMVVVALDAAERLGREGIEARVLDVHTIRPIDVETLRSAADETGLLLTVEEHSLIGGLHSAVVGALAERPVPCLGIGVSEDGMHRSGSCDYMLDNLGLTSDAVATAAKREFADRRKGG